MPAVPPQPDTATLAVTSRQLPPASPTHGAVPSAGQRGRRAAAWVLCLATAGVVSAGTAALAAPSDHVVASAPGAETAPAARAAVALPPAGQRSVSTLEATQSTPGLEYPPALDAFEMAGYTYDDAVALASLWGVTDLFETKVAAGQVLLSGEALPVAPGSSPPVGDDPTPEVRAVLAFLDAGYDYADAEQLAALWSTADPYQAKVRGGQTLLDGESLPLAP